MYIQHSLFLMQKISRRGYRFSRPKKPKSYAFPDGELNPDLHGAVFVFSSHVVRRDAFDSVAY